jgi:shikimate 5-dehydrogenase
VQHHAADQLHVEVALAEGALCGFAHRGEGRHENVVEILAAGQFVFDTTYGDVASCLLRDARERGVTGCDGRSMLRWQGALAFRLWNGMLPPDAPMRAALGESAPRP